MAIVPIPLQNCKSVKEFFKKQGKVEIPRPQQCLYAKCGLKEPLWKNGSYVRQVIYWGFLFFVSIGRFRCWRCGKTASCPYGWLIPYRRFSAETVATAIETYAGQETTYRYLTEGLADLEFVDPEMDIRAEKMYQQIVEENKVKQIEDESEKKSCRPAYTTVFYWVNFACKHIEGLLMQIQKELVHEQKRRKLEIELPVESTVENPNSDKAATNSKSNMLNMLAFMTLAAMLLLKHKDRVWQNLRAYFLVKAESRKDLLTDTVVKLFTTHTFELVIF
jgi:hypothetical protein